MKKLSRTADFEGSPVVGSSFAVTGAGDGRSAARAVAPSELTHGEVVYVVMECEVTKVTFKPVPGAEDKMTRLHTLRAGTATLAPFSAVDEILTKIKADLQAAKDKAEGKQPLPSMDASTGRKGGTPKDADPEPIPATS